MNTAKQAEADAWAACISKLEAVFPQTAATLDSEGDTLEDEEDFARPPFRYLSTGGFVLEFTPAKNRAQPLFSCTGDINRRQITSVQLNGIIKRPAEGEAWGF
jgi:hypothetical protein